MKRYIKSTMMVVAGCCWFAFAAAIGLFLFQYLAAGAGLQLFGFLGLSSTTVVLGLAHFVGLTAAACVCFVVGVGFCAYGLVPATDRERQTTAS